MRTSQIVSQDKATPLEGKSGSFMGLADRQEWLKSVMEGRSLRAILRFYGIGVVVVTSLVFISRLLFAEISPFYSAPVLGAAFVLITFHVSRRPRPIMSSLPAISENLTHRENEGSNWHHVPIWKRTLDICCLALAMPLLAPIMLTIGLLIKLASRGPVFYAHERVGYNGQRFVCFKFRTVKAFADRNVHQQHLADLMKSDVPMRKMDSRDSRLIPFGSLLRSTGLDELPQMLNVLIGDMSLVGPRPALPYEYEHYTPQQKRRFNTVPGLTGLWQVSGKNRTTFSEMIDLDIRYAEEKSLWLDLKIILKTLPAMISTISLDRAKRNTLLETSKREFQNKQQAIDVDATPKGVIQDLDS